MCPFPEVYNCDNKANASAKIPCNDSLMLSFKYTIPKSVEIMLTQLRVNSPPYLATIAAE